MYTFIEQGPIIESTDKYNIWNYFYFKLMLLFWILFPSNNPETKWINKKLFTHFQ